MQLLLQTTFKSYFHEGFMLQGGVYGDIYEDSL